MKRCISTLAFLLIVICVSAGIAAAQSTEFTYQGNLQNGGAPANGNFDLDFLLFDAVASGSQVGSIQSRANVAVANGVFTVQLDFGNQFPGANRFLEIRVRPSGSGGGHTILAPRSRLNSAPYAVKSVSADNAVQLGGITANQYVLTGDARLTDARPPTAGSANYIQNQNVGAQAASNFNISGNGSAGGTLSGNIVNAASQLNINGNRFLSISGINNIFAGVGVGAANTTGTANSFFGHNAGQANTTGGLNSFFGYAAGDTNTTGSSNSFFGYGAGQFHTAGTQNSFFGRNAGSSSTGGFANSFFGSFAGTSTTGDHNSFFGSGAGSTNGQGFNNTLIGNAADVTVGNLSFATAIGSEARVSNSNSIVLGRAAGEDTVRIPGAAMVNGNLVVAAGNLVVLNSPVSVTSLSSAGATALCRNASNLISTCSSSLRYKANINRFGPGLNLVNQLKPITFDWKEGGIHDLGLSAEDVAAIEPLLVTYNDKGEVEGVKYDRIGVVLVNAVKEQQAQIEVQKKELAEQRELIVELKVLVCATNGTAAVCKKGDK